MNTLYTLGYSLLKGTHVERKEEFKDRLKDAFPLGVVIVDIRKKDSGSLNGKAFHWGHEMAWMIKGIEWDYTFAHAEEEDRGGIAQGKGRYDYMKVPELANEDGKSSKALTRYATDIAKNGPKNEYVGELCRGLMARTDRLHCLLCACGDVLRPSANGMVWNCHRGPLAAQITSQMWYVGDKWEVKHLDVGVT